MTRPKASRSGNNRFNATTRKCFLDHLARTANVSASARAAGISGDAVYSAHRRLPDFRAEWKEALAEGYVRLETNMLADALKRPSSKTPDALQKARAQQQRLQLGLLNAHRGAVKGGTSPASAPRPLADLPTLKAQLILKLTQMRERAGLPVDRAPDAENGRGNG
jgi:hypothetical protein